LSAELAKNALLQTVFWQFYPLVSPLSANVVHVWQDVDVACSCCSASDKEIH